MKFFTAAAMSAFLLACLAPARAGETPTPMGLWRVADGSAVIRVKPCGRDLCGFIAEAPKPGPGEKSSIGRKILLGLRRDGAVWRGPIFNLDNGKTYAGEVSLSDAVHLKIKGCLPAGGLCGGETWKRER